MICLGLVMVKDTGPGGALPEFRYQCHDLSLNPGRPGLLAMAELPSPAVGLMEALWRSTDRGLAQRITH